jgi:hypothetical protein
MSNSVYSVNVIVPLAFLSWNFKICKLCPRLRALEFYYSPCFISVEYQLVKYKIINPIGRILIILKSSASFDYFCCWTGIIFLILTSCFDHLIFSYDGYRERSMIQRLQSSCLAKDDNLSVLLTCSLHVRVRPCLGFISEIAERISAKFGIWFCLITVQCDHYFH